MSATTPTKKNSSNLQAIDHHLDQEIKYEFGGPVGVTLMMIFFPCLMYYLWACLDDNQGKLILPASFTDLQAYKDVVMRVVNIVQTRAPITQEALVYYGIFTIFEGVLALILPGPTMYGLPIPSLNGKKLPYLCNGVSCWWVTLIVAAVLHVTHTFRLTWIQDQYGPLMTAAIIYGIAVTWITYFVSVATGNTHRMSGNFFYDLFMGAPLNPRLFGGRLDLKMFVEIRIPWVLLFFISLSAALKEYETHGRISFQILFMVMAHFLYTNACMKGEECIPTTWDIFYEKWGFMLIFWNFAGVPFTYCFSSVYIAKLGLPFFEASSFLAKPWYVALVFGTLIAAYYMWDTANSQKNRFRASLNESYVQRLAFPQLPWGTLTKAQALHIKTQHGSLLLTGGWWAYARKIHYTGDLIMALCWGLITGFDSVIPYFYVCFFTTVLVHRVTRDVERCRVKYGKDWDTYEQTVPYIFIPYVY